MIEPPALAAARRSLDESGLLLLGENHGVRENPLLIRALLQAFGLTSLALEWDEDLAPVIRAARSAAGRGYGSSMARSFCICRRPGRQSCRSGRGRGPSAARPDPAPPLRCGRVQLPPRVVKHLDRPGQNGLPMYPVAPGAGWVGSSVSGPPTIGWHDAGCR